MNEMFRQIIIGSVCTIFGSALILIPRWIKRGASMPKLVSKLLRMMETILKTNEAQNQAIMLNNGATAAILEALICGKVNGNITTAKTDNETARVVLSEAGKEMGEFLRLEAMGGKHHD